MEIIGTIWFFTVLLIALVVDLRKWMRERATNHKGVTVWRIAALIPSGVLLTLEHPPLIIRAIAVGLYLAVCFFVLFNGLYNKLRGYKWFYVGSEQSGPGWFSRDSWTERILRQLKPWQIIAVNMIAVAITLAGYVITR